MDRLLRRHLTPIQENNIYDVVVLDKRPIMDQSTSSNVDGNGIFSDKNRRANIDAYKRMIGDLKKSAFDGEMQRKYKNVLCKRIRMEKAALLSKVTPNDGGLYRLGSKYYVRREFNEPHQAERVEYVECDKSGKIIPSEETRLALEEAVLAFEQTRPDDEHALNIPPGRPELKAILGAREKKPEPLTPNSKPKVPPRPLHTRSYFFRGSSEQARDFFWRYRKDYLVRDRDQTTSFLSYSDGSGGYVNCVVNRQSLLTTITDASGNKIGKKVDDVIDSLNNRGFSPYGNRHKDAPPEVPLIF